MRWRLSSRFKYIAKPLLAIVATLLALLVAEVLVRVTGRAPAFLEIDLDAEASPYRRSENPVLAYELKPGFGHGAAGARIVTNSHGQRDLPRKLEKSAGQLRTILLGDSVVQGAGIGQLDATISGQLEGLLADPAHEVLNFGVDGYCTRAEVELLEVKGVHFQPDHVVLLFVENDFDNFNPEVERLATKRPQIANFLFRRSALFRLATVQLNLFHFAIETDPLSWHAGAIGDNNVVSGLSRLRQLADQYHFEVVIAIWPRFGEESIEDVHQVPGSEELVIERLAADLQMPTVRLSKHFNSHWESIGKPGTPRRTYTSGDQMHPSVLGCQVAAGSLQTILQDLQAGRLHPAESSGTANGKIDTATARLAKELGNGNQPTNYPLLMADADNARQAEGGLSRAKLLYRRAMELKPDLPFAYYNLATLLEQEGRAEEARTIYARASRCQPPHLKSHFNLAMLLMRGGDFTQAVQHLKQVISIEPRHLAAHFNLGLIYRQTGQNELARQTFQTILRYHPENQHAASMLHELDRGSQPAPGPEGK